LRASFTGCFAAGGFAGAGFTGCFAAGCFAGAGSAGGRSAGAGSAGGGSAGGGFAAAGLGAGGRGAPGDGLAAAAGGAGAGAGPATGLRSRRNPPGFALAAGAGPGALAGAGGSAGFASGGGAGAGAGAAGSALSAAGGGFAAGVLDTRIGDTSSTRERGTAGAAGLDWAAFAAGEGARGGCSTHSTGPSTLKSHLAAASLTPGSFGIRGSAGWGAGWRATTGAAVPRDGLRASPATTTRGRASRVASSIAAGRPCRAATSWASFSPPMRGEGILRASTRRPRGATSRRRPNGSVTRVPPRVRVAG
jgi:hypothetical protein